MLDAAGFPDDGAGIRKALAVSGRARAAEFAKKSTAELRAFLLPTVSKITVAEEWIDLVLAKHGLRHTLLGSPKKQGSDVLLPKAPARQRNDEDLLHLRIDVRLRRCGSEIRLVIPPDSCGERQSRIDEPLLKAVARGHVWHEKLVSGEIDSLRVIAKKLGVHERYVGRIFRSAFLAPDIVEAILEGRQPPQLTVEKLRLGVPLLWAEQRKAYGFGQN